MNSFFKSKAGKLLCIVISILMLVAVIPMSASASDISVINYEFYDGKIVIYANVSSASNVTFPTWTSYNSQDDLIWHNGFSGSWAKDGYTYNWAVIIPISEHNYEAGTYITHVYANNNSVFVASAEYYVDTIPKINKITYVQNKTSGYWVYASVSGTAINALSRVQYPTWTSNNGQDDLISDWSTNSSATGTAGSWTIDGTTYNNRYYVDFAAHNGETGLYITHVYAYSVLGAAVSDGITMTPNFTTPTITRATCVQDGASGYYVYAQAETNGSYDIDRVQFPTWTSYNSQDDIAASWETNSAVSGTAGSWTVDGQSYNYRYYVSVADHNNEYGTYNTDIYVYNKAGLYSSFTSTGMTFRFNLNIDPNGGSWNGTTSTSAISGAYGSSYTVTDPTPPTGYSFTGWSNSGTGTWNAGTKQFTYSNGTGTLKANYSINSYTAKFVNEDGTVLQNSDWDYGTTPVYSGATPTKAADGTNHYSFASFSPAPTAISANTTYTAQFNATEHSFTATETAPASCLSAGATLYTCACGYSYTDNTTPAATGHTPGTPATCTAAQICTVCNTELTPAKGHTAGTPVIENEVAATCTAKGSYDTVTYCTECGTEISRVNSDIEMLAHTTGDAVIENEVAATCTAKGSYDTVTYCTECGTELSRVNADIEMLAHTQGDAVIENEVAATCTAKGSYDTVIYCTECGTELSRVNADIEMLAHTQGDAVIENEVAATCTAKGSYDTVIYCTECGTELSRVNSDIEMLAHTQGDAVIENEVAATCTAKGSYDTVTYCTECGTELSRDNSDIEILAHTQGDTVIENEVAATCTAKGSYDTVIYCTECGTELSRVNADIEMLAHTTGDAVIENKVDATCTAKGSYDTVTYCTECGTELSRENEEIEILAHTAGAPVTENVTATSCTESGTCEKVVYCTVCKAELSRTVEDVASGEHTPGEAVSENVKVPTCTTSGSHDEVVYCTECGVKVSSTHVSDILTGHTDEDGDNVCDSCGMKLTSLTTGEPDEDACDLCGLTGHHGEKGSGMGIITARGGLLCWIYRIVRMFILGAEFAGNLAPIGFFPIPV